MSTMRHDCKEYVNQEDSNADPTSNTVRYTNVYDERKPGYVQIKTGDRDDNLADAVVNETRSERKEREGAAEEVPVERVEWQGREANKEHAAAGPASVDWQEELGHQDRTHRWAGEALRPAESR